MVTVVAGAHHSKSQEPRQEEVVGGDGVGSQAGEGDAFCRQ